MLRGPISKHSSVSIGSGLYIDHGWREMQWSTHCNTEDVRWTLRERGITLAGPAPLKLVGEVSAEALRSKMRDLIENFLPSLSSWTSLDLAWTRRYAVTSLCRMLYTIDTGEVASKREALDWAAGALDPAWKDLIQQAIVDRGAKWDDPPRQGSVAATEAFARYAKESAVSTNDSVQPLIPKVSRPVPAQ